MTTKELINTLLDKDQDKEVLLQTTDERIRKITGVANVVFEIDSVSPEKHPTILFTDWRDKDG